MRKPLTVLIAAALGFTAVTSANAEPAGAPADTALLITGDQIAVRTAPDGRRTATVQHAAESGLGRVLVHLNVGRRSYEVPAAALPYLGRGLDWSLFDVDAVLRAQQDDQLSVQSGQGARRFTAAEAKEFGANLVRRFLEDRKRGAYGTFEPAMSLPGAPGKPIKPAYEMHTLTVTANGSDGKPDNGGTAVVYNTDDGNLLDPSEFTNVFVNGVAKFSVPEGHYSALGLFFDTDADGNVTAVRYSAQPELSVSTDVTTRVDARQASSKVTWVTPRPALLEDGGFVLRREPVTGPALTVDIATGPGVPVWVSPTKKPVSTGKLQSYPYNRLSSPPGPGTPYEYQLQQVTTGIIPQQRYVVRPDSVATIDANYYSDMSSVGIRQRAGMYAFEDLNIRGGHQIVLPRKQTEYISADPAILWYGGLAKYTSGVFGSWSGGQYDTGRTYQPGQSLREDWNRFPLHPVGQVSMLDPASRSWYTVPAATRQGDTLRINLVPFSDNQPGHTGFGYAGESRDKIDGAFQITQNGEPVSGGEISQGGIEFRTDAMLDPAPSTIKLSLDARRQGPMYVMASHSHTEWTWQSSHISGVTLPNAFACELRKGQEPDRECAVEPLMTLQYLVGNLSVQGIVPNGAQTLDLSVGHLQQIKAPAITGATVQFSIDEGATWQDASVAAQGNGSYRATFTATAPTFRGADVALRVNATDANGGQISETLTRAYQIFG